jgi:hypothetical protein
VLFPCGITRSVLENGIIPEQRLSWSVPRLADMGVGIINLLTAGVARRRRASSVGATASGATS